MGRSICPVVDTFALARRSREREEAALLAVGCQDMTLDSMVGVSRAIDDLRLNDE